MHFFFQNQKNFKSEFEFEFEKSKKKIISDTFFQKVRY
jgi:hypothetical protein